MSPYRFCSIRPDGTGEGPERSLGPVGSELFTRMRPEVLTASAGAFVSTPLLHAEDTADSVAFVVTRSRHVAVDEVLLRPSTSG